MTDAVVKVLCVDDNALVGDAVRVKLGRTGRSKFRFEWLGQLMNANDLVAAASKVCPDIVLLDLDMPGLDPFVALAEMTATHPHARVIVLTGHIRRDYIDRAFEAGAWGYISKSEEMSSLVSAIERVMSGQVVVGADVESVIG